MKTKGWKKISSKIIYKNKHLIFTEEKLLNDKNEEINYGVVYKTPFVIIIAEHNQKLVMIKQYRFIVNEEQWEFPGGNVESEDLLTAAKREFQEESGFRAGFIKEIGRCWVAVGQTNQEEIVYFADSLSMGKSVYEPGESGMKVDVFSFEQILKMIKNGEIKDSPTISAFEFYRLYRGK